MFNLIASLVRYSRIEPYLIYCVYAVDLVLLPKQNRSTTFQKGEKQTFPVSSKQFVISRK